MKTLLVGMRMELTLLSRSRVLLVGGVLMALIGMWEASKVRESPQAAWGTIVFAAWLTTLILALTTGDAVDRDRVSLSLSSIDHTPAAGPEYGVRLILAVQRQLPPTMPQKFVWNRCVLLCIAILLTGVTVWRRARNRLA